MTRLDNHSQPIHALLIQPPPGDLTGPYPALCYLKSYAAQHDFRVQVRDLGIDAFYYFNDNLKILNEHAEALLRSLEAKPYLNENEQYHYHLLKDVISLDINYSAMSGVVECLKNFDTFFTYSKYYDKQTLLDGFFKLLSAVSFPTIITPSDYPPASLLKTMNTILLHCHLRFNPYVAYYENVLFPEIERIAPPVIGISMVFGAQATQALVLGAMIRKKFPAIHVTMGGAYLSQWMMQTGKYELEEIFACMDSVICGEGEEPFTELLKRIIHKKSLDGVPNLIYKDAATNEFRRFSEMNYTDISVQPPPDFSDLDLSKYLSPQTVIPYSISRGCYWGKCAFCQNRYGDFRMRRYQTVPIEKAVAEMVRLSEQYHSKMFNFSNDVIDPSYLKKLSRALLDQGHQFIWNTDLRAESAFTADVCRLMADAGLNCVAIGFESGCQKVLDAMDKGNHVEVTRKVLKNLYDAGIATQVMGIFGFPGETEKDAAMTVKFLEDNIDRISYYVVGLLMVMPGSKMYDHPKQYGISAISYENNPLKFPEPIWKSKKRISAESVQRLYRRLSKLEDIYVINDYPYIGALSTNHSFWYFQQGPDILKRLKKPNPLK